MSFDRRVFPWGFSQQKLSLSFWQTKSFIIFIIAPGGPDSLPAKRSVAARPCWEHIVRIPVARYLNLSTTWDDVEDEDRERRSLEFFESWIGLIVGLGFLKAGNWWCRFGRIDVVFRQNSMLLLRQNRYRTRRTLNIVCGRKNWAWAIQIGVGIGWRCRNLWLPRRSNFPGRARGRRWFIRDDRVRPSRKRNRNECPRRLSEVVPSSKTSGLVVYFII
jgi:hypothetical protein